MCKKIQVWQDGGKVLIRSDFSREYDLVAELYSKTNENAWLIGKNMPITDFNKGQLIHVGPDDFPACFLGEYGILSGNHASGFARKLLIFDHGFKEKDLGAIFSDEKGNEFCLMEICDEDNLLIHPLAAGNAPYPGFTGFSGEKLFFQGRTIPVIITSQVQMYPSNRIARREFLADGTAPLPQQKLTECDFLDCIFDYDVVDPAALVDMVKNAPGKAHFPRFSDRRYMMDMAEYEGNADYDAYRALPALMSFKVTMRYDNCGACVSYRHLELKQPLTSLENLDVMYIWSGKFSEMPIQEFYIPKSGPVELTADDGRRCRLDFSCPVRFDKNFPANCMMTQSSVAQPEHQPERFIRFSGDENGRKLGAAVGYSLINGLSSESQWRKYRPYIYQFAPTWKMYPRISGLTAPAAGWQSDTVSFRQYFDPAAQGGDLISFAHYEYDDLIIYLDCQQKMVARMFDLPPECAGCRMEIVEKTGDLEITFENGKLILDSASDFSSCVLRFSVQKSRGFR